MHDFVGDTNLRHVLLAGVGVVGVNDATHILKAFFSIAVVELTEILKMVVRDIVAVFIDSTAENSMGQWIAGCFDFPASVDKHLRALGSLNGIKHDGDIAAHWVLHTAWDADTAACETVNLVFYGAGAYSYITEQVREVAVILRVQHFIGTGKTGFFDGSCVELADGDQAFQKIRLFLRVRLVEHALVAFACCPGFIGIDTRYHNDFVSNLLLNPCQTVNIFHDRLFTVSGAWADN